MRKHPRLKAFRTLVSAVLSAALVLSLLMGVLALPVQASAAPVAVTKVLQEGVDEYAGMTSVYVSTDSDPVQNQMRFRKSSSSEQRAFLRIDLASIPKGADITGAELELTTQPWSNEGDSTVRVAVYRVNQDWNEADITWDNSIANPMNAPTFFLTQPIGCRGGGDICSFELTDLVQQWVDEPGENFGLILQFVDAPSTGLYWRSLYSETFGTAAYRPKLTVNYTIEAMETVLRQGQNGYAGAEDVHLAEDPGKYSPYNYGGMTNDLVGRMEAKADGKKRTLYRFDVSSVPSGAAIVNATLELYLLNGAGTPVTMEAREVLENWVEGNGLNTHFTTEGVSWDTQPLIGGTAAGVQKVENTTGWYAFTLTDLVQQWVDGSKPNYGVALMDRDEAAIAVNFKAFASSENADAAKRPVLRIQYAPPVVSVTGVEVTPSTMSLVAGGSTGQLSANVLPDSATNKNVTWSTSDPIVATVDANGVVTPVGRGTATITATTEDGAFKDTSTVTVSSDNADLSHLALSPGTLSPAFASGLTGYSATVANSVTSVDITPTAADAKAVIAVNGQIVESGHLTTVPLNVGNNIVKVLATAEDGTTQKLYTVTVTRPPSANADLSDLSLSDGGLSPAFSSGTISYNAAVGYGVTGVSVTPTAADPTSTITVNGQTVASGSASASIPLSVGTNPIRVSVTAQDGTTRNTYMITVSRAANNDARLTDLEVSEGSLSPVFNWNTDPYRVSVDNRITSISVTPTAADANAIVTVNGQTVASGAASANIPLNVGSNAIQVNVTAQDGSTTKTYTVTVNRAKSTNANLNNLILSEGTLGPAFASGMTAYAATVSHSVYGVTVTPSAADPNATIQVNGVMVPSGAASQELPLDVGDNVIQVAVTAQDGITAKTYTVTVVRAPIDSADLKNLTLSDGMLSPAFDSGATSYRATVSNGVGSLTVTPTLADPMATVTVNGTLTASGTPSQAITLDVGDNEIEVKVTGQGGMTKTYTVTVTRADLNSDYLSYLSLSDGTLGPAFASGVAGYTADAASHIVSVKVTAWTADPDASVTVNGKPVANGSPSGPIPLKAGDNTILVTVTSQDGSTQKTYTVIVTRGARANADLINLALSSGSLDPAFTGSETGYNATVENDVNSLTVTPTAADPNAALSVNDTAVASAGTSPSIPLKVGNNRIQVTVTAEDGVTAKTYTIQVTRKAASSSDSESDSGSGTMPTMPTTPDTDNPPADKPDDEPDHEPSEPMGTGCPKFAWSDVRNHWAQSDIESASQQCVVYGVSNDEFLPDVETTRLQFALMVARALKLNNIENATAMEVFKDREDIPGWAKAELPAAVQAGIIVGYDDGTLRPNQKINRAEMITMLIRGWGIAVSDGPTMFADDADIPNWAKGYVAKAAEMGIIVGRLNNRFEPSGLATRAEAAVVLVKLLLVRE